MKYNFLGLVGIAIGIRAAYTGLVSTRSAREFESLSNQRASTRVFEAHQAGMWQNQIDLLLGARKTKISRELW